MKRRADELLVKRSLAPTRSKARALIMAGQVRSGDRVIDKAGTMLDDDTDVEITESPRYVSRGGYKLEHALDRFGVDPAGFVCADIGASTGGFTDVLLQRDAARVYAIDVGYGQFDYSLRVDPRVTVMERTNARYLETLPEPADLVVVDVSFISLSLILPAVRRILKPETGTCIALIKPQFEAGKGQVGKGGVVRDSGVHKTVLRNVEEFSRASGLQLADLCNSPITGPAGNREFLGLLKQAVESPVNIEKLIDDTIRQCSTDREFTDD